MATIPIKKINNPNGSGKCYPLSVLEATVLTKDITVNCDLGGYRKGDVIRQLTSLYTIFNKLIGENATSNIITQIDDDKHISDSTVYSSKCVSDALDRLVELIEDKEDKGVAAELIQQLIQNVISNHATRISDLEEDIRTRATTEFVQTGLDNANERINGHDTRIENLESGKQDKLVWYRHEYSRDDNQAVTQANLLDLERSLKEEFAKVTELMGEVTIGQGQTLEQAALEAYEDNHWNAKYHEETGGYYPRNGNVIIVGDSEYIYYSNSWHEYGNLNGYIRKDRGEIDDNDIAANADISQDKIRGLVDALNQIANKQDKLSVASTNPDLTIDSNNTIKHTNIVSSEQQVGNKKLYVFEYDEHGHITKIKEATAADIPGMDQKEGTLEATDGIKKENGYIKHDVDIETNTKKQSGNSQSEDEQLCKIKWDSFGHIVKARVATGSDLPDSIPVTKLADVNNKTVLSILETATSSQFGPTEGADLTSDTGVLNAIYAILIKLGMKAENITTL